jgi:alanine racemase
MKITRRRVLGASLVVPSLAGANAKSSDSPVTVAPKDSWFDPWVEIHPENLRHNVEQIARRVESRPILAVIKNNGYGMGVANVAQLLEPLSAIAGFAVVRMHEAMTLRDTGISKPVLLMGSTEEKNLADCVARRIMPMVYTPVGGAIDRVAAKSGQPIPIHVCLDTGLGREGVPYQQAKPFVEDLAGRKSVEIQGIMTTFTEDQALDQEQVRRFRETCGALEASGIKLGKKHTASSFTIFQHPEAFLDMVRPGMAIYGIYSENEFRHSGVMDLRPALSLKSRIVYVKQLRTGDNAGYDRAYTARSEVWVATLPVGHADGWPRITVKGAKVLINGALCPVIASSASHTIVELGNDKRAEIGDIATCFGWEAGARPEDVSEACGASVYDLTMHLNPLLPRRIL